MKKNFAIAALALVVLMFCPSSHATATIVSAPSITITTPYGGELFHVGDTLHINWTTPSGISATTPIQIGIRDSRYSEHLSSGEMTIVPGMPNTGHYDWVVPSSFGGLSLGTLGGTSVYSIVLYLASGGITDSFCQSPPFSIGSSGTLIVTKNMAYANQTVSGPQIHKKVCSFILTNSSLSDNFKITAVRTGLSGAMLPFANVQTYINSSQVGETTGVIPMINRTLLMYILPASMMTTVEVFADFTATAPFAVTLQVEAINMSTFIPYTTAVVNGQNFTL